MRLGGGLHYLDGPQGHGKSYYSVRAIHRAMWRGQYVVTNVRLLPGWAERMVRHESLVRRLRVSKRELVRQYESLYVHTDVIGDVFRFDIPCKACGALRDAETGKCTNGHPMGEGRALMVWDEAHNDLNNRSWQESSRQVLMKGATQLRKLGYVALLVTQHKDNTDAALRRVCGWRIRMVNLKEHARGPLGFTVIPVAFFIAGYYPANTEEEKGQKAATYERFFLGWQKRLYDSWGIYSGLYEDLAPLGDRVVLPPAGAALAPYGAGVVPPDKRLGAWWRDLEAASDAPALVEDLAA